MVADNYLRRQDLSFLVNRAKEGDRAAFDDIVRATYIDTFTLAKRLTNNEEDAADVVQEAYMRAWKSVHRFRGDSQFSTWMYRITANTAYTFLAKRNKAKASSIDDMVEPHDTAMHRQPMEMAESQEFMAEVETALRKLPTKLRAVVVLKDIYDLSHDEIADELGISVSATKVRLHRGRRKLRDELFVDDVGRKSDAV